MRHPVRWTWWIAGTLVIGAAWTLFAQTPLRRQSELLGEKHAETVKAIQALDARIVALPGVLSGVDSSGTELALRLQTYTPASRLERLISDLSQAGARYGLEDIRVMPHLDRLLNITSPPPIPGTRGSIIDTLPVGLFAKGGFVSLGQWMESVEARPDFRYWQSCQWSEIDDGRVGVEFRAAFLVVRSGDRLVHPRLAGSGQ